PWAESALAFNVAQLNRDTDRGGLHVNQLMALEAAGVLKRLGANNRPAPPLDSGTLAKQPRLADPTDARAALDARARAYLHANCGHCHRFGGGGAVDLELHGFTPL